jgi:hypothetical protein
MGESDTFFEGEDNLSRNLFLSSMLRTIKQRLSISMERWIDLGRALMRR